MSTFHTDLARAKQLEDLVYRVFAAHLPTIQVPTSLLQAMSHPPDLLVLNNGSWWNIEVKADWYSLKSGNVCFEKRALQEVSLPNTLVIYFVRNQHQVLVFNLETLLAELPGVAYRTVMAGDQPDNLCYLVKQQDLQKLTSIQLSLQPELVEGFKALTP